MLTLTILIGLFFNPATAPAPETISVKGKVMELTEVVAGKGIKVDAEPIAKQVVLVGADGSITPLLSDEASRAFFLDKRMRNRETVILARKHTGLPYLQVVSCQLFEDGKLRTPEYYCEVCSISVRYPQDCPCCQGPLIFQMKFERD
jgi:hypothetical protein